MTVAGPSYLERVWDREPAGNPTMTWPSGDDRSVSRSTIFGVVRRALFVLHMCGLFHYTCLTDFSFAYIL